MDQTLFLIALVSLFASKGASEMCVHDVSSPSDLCMWLVENSTVQCDTLTLNIKPANDNDNTNRLFSNGDTVSCPITRTNIPILIQCLAADGGVATERSRTSVACAKPIDDDSMMDGCFVLPKYIQRVMLSLEGCRYTGGPMLMAEYCSECDVSVSNVVADGERWILLNNGDSDTPRAPLFKTKYQQLRVHGRSSNISVSRSRFQNASQSMRLHNLNQITIRDVYFENVFNLADRHTSALDIREVTTVLFEHVRMVNGSNNVGNDYGGCVLINAFDIVLKHLTLKNCLSFGSGGGIGLVLNHNAWIENVTMDGATARYTGGGFYILAETLVSLVMRDIRLVRVTSNAIGGGIVLNLKTSTWRTVVVLSNVYVEVVGSTSCIGLMHTTLVESSVVIDFHDIDLHGCLIGTTKEDWFISKARRFLVNGVATRVSDRQFGHRSTLSETLYLSGVNNRIQKTLTKKFNGSRGTTTPSNGITSSMTGAVSNTVRGLTLAGVLMTTSDFVVGTQTLEAAWICKGSDAISHNNRRPYLSLARVVPYPLSSSTSRLSTLKDAWEVSMLMSTVALVTVLHFVGTVLNVAVTKHRPKKRSDERPRCAVSSLWLRSVTRCHYPQYSLRVHSALMIPTISCMTVVVVDTSSSSSAVVVGIVAVGTVCFCLLLLGTHVIVALVTRDGTSLSYTSKPGHRGGRLLRHIVPHGVWRPKSSVAMCGLFFSSYVRRKDLLGDDVHLDDHHDTSSLWKGYLHVSPHVWVWIPMCLGAVMSVLSNTDHRRPEDHWCEAASMVGGVVWFVFGVLHVYPHTAMDVSCLGMVRGVRWMMTGITMVVIGIYNVGEGRYLRDEVGWMIMVTVVIGLVENLLRFVFKVLTKVHRHK